MKIAAFAFSEVPMSFDDGMVRIRFFELSGDHLQNAAYILTDDEYSRLIRMIGEAFLTELKRRAGMDFPEWFDFDLTQFSEAELVLTETQLDVLRDEAPHPLPSFFNVFKLSVHHELLRRSGPGLQ
jgi:hypothetical protein